MDVVLFRFNILLGCVGEGRFELHYLDVASVTSKLTVSIQVKDPGLGLGFSVRKGLCRKYGYGQN